jgi:hypothetical protein
MFQFFVFQTAKVHISADLAKFIVFLFSLQRLQRNVATKESGANPLRLYLLMIGLDSLLSKNIDYIGCSTFGYILGFRIQSIRSNISNIHCVTLMRSVQFLDCGI